MTEVPERIGRFEVTAELGRGSMGIVHLVHDPLMGRDLAIKTVLLPHGLAPDKLQEFHERFLREARAAGRLSHPGIVTVYDFNDGAETGSPFIAMEYVEGPTLHDLLRQHGSLSPSWALSIAETLADALQAAHAAGVIHRDLKPANILVRETDGAAKISDFGVARINTSELTGSGTTHGSPAYMAPERLRGAIADVRSDLFALAVIVYEMLCGERPFAGDDFATTCAAILNAPPLPIVEREPSLAPAFDRFFARALDKDPDERLQTAADFRSALRALHDEQDCFQCGETTTVLRVPLDRRKPRAGAKQGTVVALALCAIAILVSVISVTRSRRQEAAALPPATEVAGESAELAPPINPPQRAKATPSEPVREPPPVVPPARIELQIKNRVKAGSLALFVDGKEIYRTDLTTEKVLGPDRAELAAAVDVPAGRHTLRAEMFVTGEARKHLQSLSFDVEPGATRGLVITVGRKPFGPRLALTFE